MAGTRPRTRAGLVEVGLIVTPARAARRHRRRVAHWLGHSLAEALRLGAGPTELRKLTAVAAALRMKAVAGVEDGPATTPLPRGR